MMDIKERVDGLSEAIKEVRDERRIHPDSRAQKERMVIEMKISKIPASIKRKMRKLARLSKEAAELDNEISEWFCSKGFDEDALRCGDGASLEELNYGNDVTDEFCKRIESGEFDDAVSLFQKTLSNV